jgi:hypothetical protein
MTDGEKEIPDLLTFFGQWISVEAVSGEKADLSMNVFSSLFRIAH